MASVLNVDQIGHSTSGTTAIQIDSSGRILTPARPAFHVIRTTSMSAAGDVTYDSALFDIGSNVNLATGEFTAPITGIYVLSFSCIGLDSSVATVIYGRINGVSANSKFSVRPIGTNRNEAYASMSAITHPVQLNANDVFKLNSSEALYSDGNTWLRFSGYLLG